MSYEKDLKVKQMADVLFLVYEVRDNIPEKTCLLELLRPLG